MRDRAHRAYLSLAQLAQHHHRKCKHDNVASEHFPNVKEDGLETNVVEASSSKDDDLEVAVAIHFCTVVNQKLFKVQTVLVSNLKEIKSERVKKNKRICMCYLKLESKAAGVHFDGIRRDIH